VEGEDVEFGDGEIPEAEMERNNNDSLGLAVKHGHSSYQEQMAIP
jgi:hypothetical protein